MNQCLYITHASSSGYGEVNLHRCLKELPCKLHGVVEELFNVKAEESLKHYCPTCQATPKQSCYSHKGEELLSFFHTNRLEGFIPYES